MFGVSIERFDFSQTEDCLFETYRKKPRKTEKFIKLKYPAIFKNLSFDVAEI